MNYSPPDTKKKIIGGGKYEVQKIESLDTDLNAFRIALYSYQSGLVTFDHIHKVHLCILGNK